jgi:Predicted phosphatase/phosphohexomutase
MLVIFDCDGVLVDSEGLAAEVFSLLLAEQGMDIPPADCYQAFHGHSLSYCYAWIEKDLSALYLILLINNWLQQHNADLRRI